MEVARPKMEGAKPKSFHLVEKDTFCFSNLLVERICLIESSLFVVLQIHVPLSFGAKFFETEFVLCTIRVSSLCQSGELIP
jgi:hypothetical protein